MIFIAWKVQQLFSKTKFFMIKEIFLKKFIVTYIIFSRIFEIFGREVGVYLVKLVLSSFLCTGKSEQQCDFIKRKS